MKFTKRIFEIYCYHSLLVSTVYSYIFILSGESSSCEDMAWTCVTWTRSKLKTQ